MKKLFVIAAVLIGALSLSACNLGSQSAIDAFESSDEIYMFSAVSSVSLLEVNQTAMAQPLSVLLEETTGPIVEAEIDEVNKYVEMMEKYLGSANGLAVTESTSDRLEYEHMVVFSSVDMLGEPVEYVFYYNESATAEDPSDFQPTSEVVTTTEPEEIETTETEEIEATETEEIETTEVEEDDDEEMDEADEDDEEEMDEESEVYLSGILVVGDNEYTVTGKQEIEADESKISLTSWIDSENYVFVESKVEDEERKFFYQVVVGGVVESESKIKIETEADEMKFELEFISGDAEGKYEFKQEIEDDEEILKIEYEVNDGITTESGEIKIKINVDETTGETTYSYYIETEDEESSVVEKDRDDDDDEDDEDDDDVEDSEG